jgi:hypothetical protein
MKLCFVNRLGLNSKGLMEYELYFSDDIDLVWQSGWSIVPAGICLLSELLPEEDNYHLIERIETDIPLMLIQNQTSFSYADCTDKIIAILWEDIQGLDEYPDNRIVLYYGDDIQTVKDIFSLRDIEFLKKQI